MRLGILGGGQLSRMLADAGASIGVRCVVLDPADDACAQDFAEHLAADYLDPAALRELAERVDVVTYEFENVPKRAVETLRKLGMPVHPSAIALATAQDRWNEKQFFQAHGVRTAPFARVDDLDELNAAVERIALPAILKARRFGYDGKGQQYLAHPEQAEPSWNALGQVPCILESVVAFDREVSQISVRAADGRVVHYPLVENHHAGGVLRWSLAPAPDIAPQVAAMAQEATERILVALDYVGVLAVELFQVGQTLLANEMAPRVHNSGHWSIEGADTSQFENHVRAVLGLPLGSTDVRPCTMVNLLGRIPPVEMILSLPGARLHDYRKAPRQGRKVGHVTVLGADRVEVAERTRVLRERVEGT